MNRLLWIAGLAMVLSACSSTVKLDDVPVVDKTGSPVGSADNLSKGSDASSASAVKSTVAPVDLDKSRSDAALMASARVVYFDFDSFAIRPEFQAVIEAHAKQLRADKNRKVVIEGHTDERGGREYNLALGQKRSEAVKNALRLLGVNESQVEAVSFGKEKPAVLGDSEEAMAKNRRAEIAYR